MNPVEISVVCAVSNECGDLARVHAEFREVLARSGRRAEFLYVLDGRSTGGERTLSRIREDVFPVRVVRMAKAFGPGTALQIGMEKAEGKLVLTIPDRLQIDAATALEVLELLDRGKEVVVTRREPRTDPWLNRLQSRVFHVLVQRLARHRFRDLTCDLRGMTREAGLRLRLYADQHRFVPILAMRAGYEVTEVPGAQHEQNRKLRLRSPGVYARRLLDVLNIYFLTQFTRKPLRFFGLIGVGVGVPGAAICLLLAAQRLVADVPIRERPLLLLGVLLIVLGVQLISLGLLGEIIIFVSSERERPETYEVEIEGEESGERLMSG